MPEIDVHDKGLMVIVRLMAPRCPRWMFDCHNARLIGNKHDLKDRQGRSLVMLRDVLMPRKLHRWMVLGDWFCLTLGSNCAVEIRKRYQLYSVSCSIVGV